MLSGNNGVLQRATDAKTETEKGQEQEIVALAYNSALAKKVSNGDSTSVTDSELNDELDSNEATASGNPIIVTFTKSGNAYEIDSNGFIKPSTPKDPNATLKVADHKNEKFNTNTELEDSFGNKITVPAGFKITSDSPNSVTGGIIIEDVDAGTVETAGSQFVWIPVGKVYTDAEKTEANAKIINLGRYSFASDGTPSAYEGSNTEDTASNHNSSYENAIAKDIEEFISKANLKKGFYIGRYEARTTIQRTTSGNDLTQITEKAEDYVYNYVTQLQASSQAKNMYASNDFVSDLVNSYAWDTATLFLQELGEANYSRKSSVNSSLSNKGTSATDYIGTRDSVCNIYDMASNYWEWTTETYSLSDLPCVMREGDYDYGHMYTSYRCPENATTDTGPSYSFRPILYLK